MLRDPPQKSHRRPVRPSKDVGAVIDAHSRQNRGETEEDGEKLIYKTYIKLVLFFVSLSLISSTLLPLVTTSTTPRAALPEARNHILCFVN